MYLYSVKFKLNYVYIKTAMIINVIYDMIHINELLFIQNNMYVNIHYINIYKIICFILK